MHATILSVDRPGSQVEHLEPPIGDEVPLYLLIDISSLWMTRRIDDHFLNLNKIAHLHHHPPLYLHICKE